MKLFNKKKFGIQFEMSLKNLSKLLIMKSIFLQTNMKMLSQFKIKILNR